MKNTKTKYIGTIKNTEIHSPKVAFIQNWCVEFKLSISLATWTTLDCMEYCESESGCS